MHPTYLKAGDKIRIISPSGFVQPEFIDGAKIRLTQWGFEVSEGRFARNIYGRFAGTDEERLLDLQEALDDPGIKAILCSRGGYGLARIIDKISFLSFIRHPKWVIGFSDISLLHQAINKKGIGSIHSIMAKQLTQLSPEAESVVELHKILTGTFPSYIIEGHPLNKPGLARGELIGGNLSVISGMRGTPFDFSYSGNILFLEDIDERAYHIDRMIQNLRTGGVFSRIKGLIFGQFTNCEDDTLMNAGIYESILASVKHLDIPVVFNFPSGHIDNQVPLILGQKVALNVTDSEVSLHFGII